MKNIIHDFVTILRMLRSTLIDSFSHKSYSQEGEDMVLRRIFDGQTHGFYVDVGAHHPQRFSNTYFFYLEGWHGINIDPNPEAIKAFRRIRKRDVNVQKGVSEQVGDLTYYFFDDPALNTFDKGLVDRRLATTPYKVLSTAMIPVERLDVILSQHLPVGAKIDFLSIDAEGLDFAVLKSNDWVKFRPKCVLVEAIDSSLEDVLAGELYQFMKSKGYHLFGKTINTLFFLEKVQ